MTRFQPLDDDLACFHVQRRGIFDQFRRQLDQGRRAFGMVDGKPQNDKCPAHQPFGWRYADVDVRVKQAGDMAANHPEQRVGQVLFAVEMVVEAAFGDFRLSGNVVDAHAIDRAGGKQALRSLEQGQPRAGNPAISLFARIALGIEFAQQRLRLLRTFGQPRPRYHSLVPSMLLTRRWRQYDLFHRN